MTMDQRRFQETILRLSCNSTSSDEVEQIALLLNSLAKTSEVSEISYVEDITALSSCCRDAFRYEITFGQREIMTWIYIQHCGIVCPAVGVKT